MDDSQDLARDDHSGISVHAGFPNPAADRHGASLRLDRLLIRHPSSTYMFRIVGSNHEEQGIFDGDIALIDRALTPHVGDLVVYWEGEHFAINHFREKQEPWGVVSTVIHAYRKVAL
jgi:DNA polymerase V